MKLPSIYIRNYNDVFASTYKSTTGFTLIEILVVTAMFVLIAGFGLFVSMDFLRTYTVRSEKSILVSVFQKARNQAMVNVDQAKHGVRIDSAGYTIFATTSTFAARGAAFSALDEVINKQASITVTSTAPLPLDIIFDQLSVTSSVATTVGITVTDGVRLGVISINNEGQIDW